VEEEATVEPSMEAAEPEEPVAPKPVEAVFEASVSEARGLSPNKDILNKKCYVYIIMKYFIYAAKKPLNREINFPIR
jgi:hypothetical protein